MEHYPAILDKEQLVKLLHHIADLVESGDSFEGMLEYLIPDEEEQSTEGLTFAVRSRFRVGNSEGQGGMRIIGEFR